MARTFTIGGTDYTFPDQGGNPPWGEDVTDWANAVTDVLESISSATDILNNSFTITDNQSAATNVIGLSFDASLVRASHIEYSIFRSGSSPKVEVGTLYAAYDGSSWDLSREANADIGVVFTISGSGQVQYTSSSVGSTGTMAFRARTFAQ